MDEDQQSGDSQEPTLEEQLAASIGLTEQSEVVDGDADASQAAAPAATAPVAAPADARAAETQPAAAPAAVAPPVDPKAQELAELYAPLPEHNQRRTQERFQRLVESHKETTAKLQEAEPIIAKAKELESQVQEHQAGWQAFRDLGYDGPEAVQDLKQFSTYRTALSKGDWDTAAQVIQAQARHLAILSGRQLDVNPLAGFQDLNTRVQGGELDQATALELARSRMQQQTQIDNQRRQQAEQQQSQQAGEVVRNGAMAADQVAVELMRDPDFAKVEPALMQALQTIKTNYHPSQWANEIRRAYDTEKRFLTLQSQQRAPTLQPLRSNGHASGRPEPASMADAVLQDLGLS